jgi:hypothetical protein
LLKARKTVDVDMLLNYANGYLSSDWPGGDSAEAKMRRQGVIDLLEAALHSAGRYRGFSYLDEQDITKCQPGIRWFYEMDLSRKTGGHTFVNCDDTRRRYA